MAKIQRWISVGSLCIGLLSVFVGISLYVAPEVFLTTIDFTLQSSVYLSQMWAARQLAIGLVILFAVFKGSKEGLTVSLIAYVIMNIQDVLIGFNHADNGLFLGASFFTLVSLCMLWRLHVK